MLPHCVLRGIVACGKVACGHEACADFACGDFACGDAPRGGVTQADPTLYRDKVVYIRDGVYCSRDGLALDDFGLTFVAEFNFTDYTAQPGRVDAGNVSLPQPLPFARSWPCVWASDPVSLVGRANGAQPKRFSGHAL
jgi:hypothetical protein